MNNLEKDKLIIKVSKDLDLNIMALSWQGESNDKNPGAFLYPYFEEIAKEASDHNFSIEMDISEMKYMNSSTISPIIRLIKDLKSKRIKFIILYDGNMKWQDLSFTALRIYQTEDNMFDVINCRDRGH